MKTVNTDNLLIPVPVVDIAKQLLSSKNSNHRQSLVARLEDIKKFCEEVLAESNKKGR